MTFIIDKELKAQTGDLRLDMTYFGFSIDSQYPVGGGCSGGSCSTGGCS